MFTQVLLNQAKKENASRPLLAKPYITLNNKLALGCYYWCIEQDTEDVGNAKKCVDAPNFMQWWRDKNKATSLQLPELNCKNEKTLIGIDEYNTTTLKRLLANFNKKELVVYQQPFNDHNDTMLLFLQDSKTKAFILPFRRTKQ